MLRTVTGILALALAFSFSLDADAKSKKGKGKKKAKEEEAEGPTTPEEMDWLQKGHAAFGIRDYDKAIELYEKASGKMEGHPAPHFFIGTALKAKGEWEKAVESFRTAYLLGTGSKLTWKGAALVMIAWTYEAAGDLVEARKAWEDYVEFAAGKGLPVDATEIAKERIEAIEAVEKLDDDYEEVRERIEKGEKKKSD